MHVQAHPTHLWDAVTGKLRCSYLGYDDKDEVTAAFSVAFSADGSQVCEAVPSHCCSHGVVGGILKEDCYLL